MRRDLGDVLNRKRVGPAVTGGSVWSLWWKLPQAQELKMTRCVGRVLCQLFKSCDVTAVGLSFRGFLLRNTEKTRRPGGRWSQVSSALKSGGVSLCN